jgi:hypothetical protein
MVRFRITFASCFMMCKVHGWETFLKCRAGLSHNLVLGPLFWECPTLGFYPTHNLSITNKDNKRKTRGTWAAQGGSYLQMRSSIMCFTQSFMDLRGIGYATDKTRMSVPSPWSSRGFGSQSRGQHTSGCPRWIHVFSQAKWSSEGLWKNINVNLWSWFGVLRSLSGYSWCTE